MYQYQKTPPSCLDVGHKVIPKQQFFPAQYKPQPDIGDMPQPDMKISDAYWLRSNYTLNPPFFGLCDRLCIAMSPNPFSTRAAASSQYDVISESIDRVLFDNDCRSAEVKQFERNLRAITIKRLETPPRPRYAERSSL